MDGTMGQFGSNRRRGAPSIIEPMSTEVVCKFGSKSIKLRVQTVEGGAFLYCCCFTRINQDGSNRAVSFC